MPAYNFQRRFVSPILLGTKPHTIRRRRKNPTEPGDMIQMYTGLRTKKACKFGESPCIKIEPIILYPRRHEVLVADERGVYAWMQDYTIEALARHDGFSNTESFFYFFQHTYRDEMLDDFEIVWWDPKRVVVPPGVRFFRAGDLTPSPFPKREGEKSLLIFDDPYKDMPTEEARKAINAILEFEPKVIVHSFPFQDGKDLRKELEVKHETR